MPHLKARMVSLFSNDVPERIRPYSSESSTTRFRLFSVATLLIQLVTLSELGHGLKNNLEMKYVTLGLLIVGVVAFVTFGVVMHDSPATIYHFDQPLTSSTLPYRAVGLGIFMIIGVFCGHFYRWMGHEETQITLRSLSASLRDKSLW